MKAPRVPLGEPLENGARAQPRVAGIVVHALREVGRKHPEHFARRWLTELRIGEERDGTGCTSG